MPAGEDEENCGPEEQKGSSSVGDSWQAISMGNE